MKFIGRYPPHHHYRTYQPFGVGIFLAVVLEWRMALSNDTVDAILALIEAREHITKTDVGILDFVSTGYPALLRKWDKRQT